MNFPNPVVPMAFERPPLDVGFGQTRSRLNRLTAGMNRVRDDRHTLLLCLTGDLVCKKYVSSLTLSVCLPGIVRLSTLEVQVVEPVSRERVSEAADVDDACRNVTRTGSRDLVEDERGEEEGAEVVDTDLRLEAVFRDAKWRCHDRGAVDQDLWDVNAGELYPGSVCLCCSYVESFGICIELDCRLVHGSEGAEVHDQTAQVGRWRFLLDVFDRLIGPSSTPVSQPTTLANADAETAYFSLLRPARTIRLAYFAMTRAASAPIPPQVGPG